MAESLSDEQLAELRDRCTAEVWFGLSREEARALLADNERLQAAVQLLGTNLQGSARDFVDALAEVERRIPVEHVERFLKRERDEYEPRGECWNTVDDVLDVFRLHMVTGTPLTEPRPVEGPEAYGVGDEPLTEAEELRAEVERLRAEVERLQNKLDAPCGSCHPCTNYADETWRAAGRKPPHVTEGDELRTEVEQLRARAERAEAEAVRLHKVAERAFTEMERGDIYDAEQTLREALLIPAMASQPAAPAPVAGGCTCDEDGPCPACTVDADALTGALADEAHAPGGTHDH